VFLFLPASRGGLFPATDRNFAEAAENFTHSEQATFGSKKPEGTRDRHPDAVADRAGILPTKAGKIEFGGE
jgi:hypothetical protein